MVNVIKIDKKIKKPAPHDKRKAQEIINKSAEDSGNVIYTVHAKEQMAKRGFVFNDVLTILRDGIIRQEPRYNEEKHSWAYRVEFQEFDGERDAGCVVAIQKKAKLHVVTIMWISDQGGYYD